MGLNLDGDGSLTVIRNAPLCTQDAFSQLLGSADVTPDVVRGWVETSTIPTVKIGRRRLVNLAQITRDLERGKTIFCKGDYGDE
ncbi:DNA-binding protein [Halopseudomonas litoralis]|nr:DNA-binding protein [Halopseudomonas litoralis]